MSSQPVRLIIDPPGSGTWNMAVDEALMQSVGRFAEANDSKGKKNAIEPNTPVLRFYQWSKATLSLGYFQKSHDRETHLPSLKCPLVRRNSGGGAIIHDVELTYSFTIGENQELVSASSDFYPLLHGSLIHVLNEHGIEAIQNKIIEKNLEKNFLCFQRRAPNDVLVKGHKVCGSAQRKKYQVISQHGSVILQTSAKAPEILGINDICRTNVNTQLLIEGWIARISRETGLDFVGSELNDREKYRAKEVEKCKFSAANWNHRR